MDLREAKAKVKRHMPEIVTGVVTVLSVVGAVLVIKKTADTNDPFKPFIDADGKTRYVKDTKHIVLEHVESNIYRDMDQREDQYRLVPHATVWEDAN